MNIIDSSNYYMDFASSNELRRFFPDSEIDTLKDKVYSVFSDYSECNDRYEKALEIALDEKDIKELNEKLDNNDNILDRKLELIDEIFCLRIYSSRVVRTFSKETVEALHKLILNELDNLSLAKKPENYEGLRVKLFDWRVLTSRQSYSSYPPKEDFDETKLDRAIAKAKHLAEYTLELQLVPVKTVNQVFYLFKQRSFHGTLFPSKDPVAVLKGSKKTDESYLLRQLTSNMEEVAYHAAEILGFEELFVPAQMTSIQADGPEYAGCIQPFIKGDLLIDVHKKYGSISYPRFVEGFLVSIVMGMPDAHSRNIIINEEGAVKYFDNSRSLPPSNDVLKRPSGVLRPSYRCHLLIEENAFSSFTQEAKTLIAKRIDAAIEKFSLLEVYLQGASKKYAFPEHWLDPKLIMTALGERLSGMKKALVTCANPVDMVFTVNPFFKYYVSLCLAYQCCNKKSALFNTSEAGYLQSRSQLIDALDLAGASQEKNNASNRAGYFDLASNHNFAGIQPSEKLMSNLFYALFSTKYHGFEHLIKECIYREIDPVKIWEICQKGGSWNVWLINILGYVDTILSPSDSGEFIDKEKKAQALKKSEEAILTLLHSQAIRDNKDPGFK